MADFNIGFVQFTQLEEDKRTEKSPDVTGFIEVLATDVNALINYLQTAELEEDYRGNKVVKLRLAGWNGTYRKNKPMLKGKLSAPYRSVAKMVELEPAATVAANSGGDFAF